MDTQAIQEQEIEINLKDYIAVLCHRRWAVLTFFIVTVFIVTIATFLQVPVYRATTTVLIDEETPDMLSVKDGLALGSPGYVSYREYYQTQLEIIKSRAIAKEVYYLFKLEDNTQFAKAKDPIKFFLSKLKIEPSRNTRLVSINFEDKDKVLAAGIVNEVAKIYTFRNLVYISKNETLNLLKNEHIKLQSKYSEMTKVYKDKHPKMIRLKEEISQMEEKMRKEEGDPLKASGIKTNNVRIIDEAEVPKHPVRPKRLQNFMLAIIGGLVGGMALALILEHMDNTVKSSEDIDRHIKLPLLGCVPTFEGRYTELERDKFVHLEPNSPASEAYRSIRTSIVFSSSEQKTIRDILITSACPQEGKSMTAANLAVTFAKNGNSVVLVDADMRKPRLHEIFALKNDNGLSNFLTGQSGIDEIINKTNIEHLHVITCGHIPPNPSELLGTKRMKEFIEKLKAKYDRIILDSPPLMVVTDSVMLSGVIDSTILVINSKKTDKSAIHRSKQLLANAKANILGVILNNVHIDRASYYSHYYSHSKEGKARRKKRA